MKWISNKIIIGSGIFFSVFFSVFLSSSSYAISDVVYTIDSTNYTQDQVFCGGSTGINCSDYSYFVVELSNSPASNASINFSFYSNTTVSISAYPSPVTSVWSFNSWSTEPKYQYLQNSGSGSRFCFNNGLVVTITLTDTSPTAPCPEPEEPEPCPECEVCPVIPDNPYDDKFDAIVRAIYVGCATLLVLYFFYCIYRIIIRNSGVK